MTFKVAKEKCDQCLFSPNKIVSDDRRKEILQGCKKDDAHFVCHKTDDTCCRGFFESQSTNMIRIAGRLGMIQEV